MARATLIGQLKLPEGVLHPQALVVANANGGFPGGRSFRKAYRQKILKVREIVRRFGREAEYYTSIIFSLTNKIHKVN